MGSISTAQSSALADNFLDDIGSSGEFQPRETLSEIFQLAGELIEDAQQNLNDTKTNASGNLSASIAVREPITAPGLIQIDIEMNAYGQFVNKGVKGTKSGQGLYSFKNDVPGTSMVKAIQQYIKDAKSKLTNVKKRIGYEIKHKSVSDASNAFAMARSILQHGIRPVYFMDKAIDSTDKKVTDRLSGALGIDIINSLPDNL